MAVSSETADDMDRARTVLNEMGAEDIPETNEPGSGGRTEHCLSDGQYDQLPCGKETQV